MIYHDAFDNLIIFLYYSIELIATRPLLRQIENLQSSYGNQTQTWERVERNLTERLSKYNLKGPGM